MTDEAPKDRLRQARTLQKLSRERLAQILGWSASTIRAHETGQNQIRPDAAAAYRDALGVSPSWLLYGTPDEAPDMGLDLGFEVEVVGEIWERTHFVPADEIRPAPREFVRVNGDGYKRNSLIAYIVRGDNWHDRKTKHLIVQKPGKDIVRFLRRLSLRDELVLRVREGRLEEVALWHLGAGARETFTFYKGAEQASASAILHLPDDEALLREHIVGVVVEEQVRRTIWPADPDDEEDEESDDPVEGI